ncbi:signal peptidase I [Streptomyces sp. NPDC002506]|uniref:signal peptidase I n=1 Tax=Streptomyces sp. NPDC002506 TaxID=3154536 RepID=UPI00332F5E2F
MGSRGRSAPAAPVADHRRRARPARSAAASAVPAARGPGGRGGRAERRRRARKVERRGRRSAVREIPLLIMVAVLVALVLKTFLVQAFVIPSGSMQQTLTIGDRVLVDKLTPWFGWKPERGEVVVFKDPGGWLKDEQRTPPGEEPVVVKQIEQGLTSVGLLPSDNERDLIKRVVGIGGDTVECKGTGPLKVNGRTLDEPYVFPGNTPCSDDEKGQFKVTVPRGRIWVMGDHRQASGDSRYHRSGPGGGAVSTDEVVGRAFTIAWPLDRIGRLAVPGTFDRPGLRALGVAAPAAVGLVGAGPLVLRRLRGLRR